MIVAVPDDRIAPWLTLHPPWVCLAHPLLCSTKRQKICTPYTARVCICIGITSTFHPVDIKKIFAQKTALWRGFLMPGSLDFESAKTWMAVSEK